MSDPGGRDLPAEWRRLVDSLVNVATSAAGRAPIPPDLLKVSQRQVELLGEVLERERRLRGELTGLVTAPLDAMFDLLEETGKTLRLQAEALESAGRALEETARLTKRQSERFERTVSALRQPADLAKAAAGGRRNRRDTGSATSRPAPTGAAAVTPPGPEPASKASRTPAAKPASKPASKPRRKAAAKPARKAAAKPATPRRTQTKRPS